MGHLRRSFRLQVYGYLVMPEHVHLLLSEPQRDTLADALKSLKQGVSRRLIGDADHQHENASERWEDFVQPSNCPTQAKTGLEWATRPSVAYPPRLKPALKTSRLSQR